MSEQWRPIPGFQGYEASDAGRIRSCWLVGGAHNRGRRMGSEWRILKGWVNAHGYRIVNLVSGDSAISLAVHILVTTTFQGPRPDGQEVRHLDGQQLNNQATNLRWGTRSEQQFDKVRHGTHQNARKTRCKWGHAFTAENTYITPSSGRRSCRACRALREARSKRTQTAAASAA